MSLGCGVYRAFIQERGGGDTLAELPWHSLSFGRRLDDMSAASVSVAAAGLADEKCCTVLGELMAWRHELAIWRDGTEVWVGVVAKPEYTHEGVTVPSRDLFQWFERRALPYDRSFVETDLGAIFAQVVEDALSRDTTPNIEASATAVGVLGSREVTGANYQRAADAMRELARSGIDFTMVGRRLVLGGPQVPAAQLPMVTDGMLENTKLVVDGLAAGTEAIVVGSASDVAGAPIVGVAGGVDPDLGLVQVVDQEGSIRDTGSAAAAALSRLQMVFAPPEYIEGSLVPEAGVEFADLIPGALVPVRMRVGCRSAIGVWRLHTVDVTVGVGDDGAVTEDVRVSLVPIGTEEFPASFAVPEPVTDTEVGDTTEPGPQPLDTLAELLGGDIVDAKTGYVTFSGGSFVAPSAAVVFAAPFDDTSYMVLLGQTAIYGDAVDEIVESQVIVSGKTAGGFTLVRNHSPAEGTAEAFSVRVDWLAVHA